jgi:hypothetical protein
MPRIVEADVDLIAHPVEVRELLTEIHRLTSNCCGSYPYTSHALGFMSTDIERGALSFLRGHTQGLDTAARVASLGY